MSKSTKPGCISTGGRGEGFLFGQASERKKNEITGATKQRTVKREKRGKKGRGEGNGSKGGTWPAQKKRQRKGRATPQATLGTEEKGRAETPIKFAKKTRGG